MQFVKFGICNLQNNKNFGHAMGFKLITKQHAWVKFINEKTIFAKKCEVKLWFKQLTLVYSLVGACCLRK